MSIQILTRNGDVMTTDRLPSHGAAPSARERLLEAADALFYSEGIHVVGVDRIIERAGVAKASLYNTFGSKDELIRAYLDRRHALVMERIAGAVARRDDPRDKLLAIFDDAAKRFAEPGYRGCAFEAASAESPAGGPVDVATASYRSWLRALFADLAAQAGARDPQALAGQLHLIYDGASLAARLDHDGSPMAACRAAVSAVIDAAVAG
jgi:AcrR family transcriptional regulator